MRGELVATAGDKDLKVSVEAEGDKWRIQIDGRELVVDAARVKTGTWSLIVDGRSVLVDVDEATDKTLFYTHRAVTPISLMSAQRKRLADQMAKSGGAKKKGETIKAPIAGRVVKINVEVGQKISAGECVAILEAMKMENEIKASGDGVVASVNVAAGDSVDTGAKLLTTKPE